MKNTYLATVKDDFELTETFREELKKKGIDLLDYHKNLNILKLASEKDIRSLKMQPFTSIERDQEVSAIDSKEKRDLSKKRPD